MFLDSILIRRKNSLLSAIGVALFTLLFMTSGVPIHRDLRLHQTEIDLPQPNPEVFTKALIGYKKLEDKNLLGNKNLLTVIDFSLSSNEKRMWVIDMKTEKVLHHILVAHGKKSGNEYAKQFSNIPNSYQSSLGFYVTGKTYTGKHGLSLYLDGMEKGFNDNARQRAIVMHGAEYVSRKFIKNYGRLGRSFGCPSVSMKNYKEVIQLLEGKTCLFIYYPEPKYLKNSKLLN